MRSFYRNEENNRIAAAVLITTFVVAAATYGLTRQSIDQQNQDLRRERDQLQTQVNDLRGQVQNLQRENQSITIAPPAGTADWRTFSVPDQGFGIRYPKNWFVTTNTNEGIGVITNFEYNGPPNITLRSGQTKRVISVISNVEGRTPQQLLADVTNTGEQVSDVQTIKTTNASAIKFTARRDNQTFQRVLIPADNRAFIIESTGSDEELDRMIQTVNITR